MKYPGRAWTIPPLLLGLALCASACVPANSASEAATGGSSGGGSSASGGRPSGGSGGASGTQAQGGNGGSGGTTGSGGSTGSGQGGTSPGPGGSGGSGGGASGGNSGSGGTAQGAEDAAGPVTGDAGSTEPPRVIPDVAPPVFPPLEACGKPSVDHLTQWLAWSGGTKPPTGSNILAQEGGKNVAKISLVACANTNWCQLVLPITNSLGGQVDLSKSAGFSMTYSAVADLWVQMRPASRYDGGDKWLILIPATGGKVETRFFPFIPEAWFYLNRLGMPKYPFATALKDVRSFVFVANTPNNELVFHGFRIDGHIPVCK